MEFYGSGRLVEAAAARRRALNLRGLAALDLRTLRPDGTPWDFRIPAHREEAIVLIEKLQPTWVIGCPPCTSYCNMDVYLNYPKMGADRAARLRQEGQMHLQCMFSYVHCRLSYVRARSLALHTCVSLCTCMLPPQQNQNT